MEGADLIDYSFYNISCLLFIYLLICPFQVLIAEYDFYSSPSSSFAGLLPKTSSLCFGQSEGLCSSLPVLTLLVLVSHHGILQ